MFANATPHGGGAQVTEKCFARHSMKCKDLNRKVVFSDPPTNGVGWGVNLQKYLARKYNLPFPLEWGFKLQKDFSKNYMKCPHLHR